MAKFKWYYLFFFALGSLVFMLPLWPILYFVIGATGATRVYLVLVTIWTLWMLYLAIDLERKRDREEKLRSEFEARHGFRL